MARTVATPSAERNDSDQFFSKILSITPASSPDATSERLSPRPDRHPVAAPSARELPAHSSFPTLEANTENDRSRGACISVRNAGGALASTRLVRITHPFHPFSGQQFCCVGERLTRYGRRLLLEMDDGTIRSVLPQWTDRVGEDPEIVIGGRRALFRVADLVELARLVERLDRQVIRHEA
jgi:hypothetical protein